MASVEKVDGSPSVRTSTEVCALCLKTPTDPRLLLCLHSLCRECIDQLLVTATERCVSCPVCRTETTVQGESAASLPKDVTRRPARPEKCSTCEKEGLSEVPTTWCEKCQAAFCNSHVGLHMVSSRHTMGPLLDNIDSPSTSGSGPSEVNLCAEHGQHQQYVCKACDQLVCGHCVVVGGHVDHKPIVLAKTVNEELRKMIAEKAAKLRSDVLPQKERSLKALSNLTKEVHERADEVQADVQLTGERVIRTVQALVKRRLQEVEDVETSRCKRLDGQKEELRRDVDAMRRALEFSENVLENADDVRVGELYSVLPCVFARLSVMESSDNEEVSEKFACLRYEACDEETLEADLGRLLGVVYPCETSATHCVVVDKPLTVSTSGHPVAFVIETKDVYGHTTDYGDSNIKAAWYRLPANVEKAPALYVEEKGKGRHEVSWTPKECGDYVAEVSISDEKLPMMLSSSCQAWTFDPDICQPELELSENSCVVTHTATERFSFVVGSRVMTQGIHSWTVRVNNPSECAEDLLIGVVTKETAKTKCNDTDALRTLSYHWNNHSRERKLSTVIQATIPMMRNDDHIRLELDCNTHTLRFRNLRTECCKEITGLPDEELVPYFCLYYEGSSFRLIS